MKKILVSFFSVLALCSSLLSQVDNQTIAEILIFGQAKTKEEVIRRALNLKKGQPYDPNILEKKKKELLDLKIFSVVEIEARQTEKGVSLWIFVKEKSPFFFEQISDYRNEIYNHFLGLRAGFKNLWGKNQQLWLSGTVGNLKKWELGYENKYQVQFFWGLNLGESWSKNGFYDFKEKRLTGKIFLGRKISFFRVQFWANYEKIAIELESSYDKGPKKLFKVGLDISYNRKDEEIFPSKGLFGQIALYRAFDQKAKFIYDRYHLEISSFFNLWKRNVLALNFKTSLTGGNAPLFERLYFGGLKTLRGLAIWTYSGNCFIVFSSEYRIPVSSERKPLENKAPGTVLYLFSDIGSLTERKEDFRLKEFKANCGLGFFWAPIEASKLRIDLSVLPKIKIVVSSDWKF
ncbi:MAG: BamA/TamA family outer membrane protein [Candidatus Aminicenantes bacterium]|nr:BamA/TamA family outer membrane protein [Candidatus Aminicenantes bacterium]